MANKQRATLFWLMDEGGPVVRWLTATQLMTASPGDLDQLQHDLLASEAVQTWLPRLPRLRLSDTFNDWHSSRIDAFENVAHKLAELGLRAGMPALDQRTVSARDWLAQPPAGQAFSGFVRVLAAAALARLGYEDAAICDVLQQKLDAMAQLADSGRHDIYVDLNDYPDIPKGRQGQPLVDPDVTSGEYSQLPSIHAIYGLAHWPAAMDTPTNRSKRDAVIDYILHDDYQALPDGYGLLRDGPRRYYAIGWSVHLPGWCGVPDDGYHQAMALQRMELMSRFAAARASDWFSRGLAHLRSFRDDDGVYDLPAVYLREILVGYYVTGAHMGLDQGRRTRRVRRTEGTLRMLRLSQAT